MATKPTSLPTWATDAGTTVEPSAGQKAAGFSVGTRPPARWWNWLMNVVYQWCNYVNEMRTGEHIVTVLTGSGTYTTPENCRRLRFRAWGGGGAGAGCPAHPTAANASVGGGGGGGGYSEEYVESPDATYDYACGAGGHGLIYAPYSDGGPTTVTGVLAAPGGGYGSLSVRGDIGATSIYGVGGQRKTGGSGSLAGGGSAGETGFACNIGSPSFIGCGGAGGSSPVGYGGSRNQMGASGNSADGNDATGYASGGSGAWNYADNVNGRAGGSGSDGIIIVDEYY